MADERPNTPAANVPPKIKLNLNSSGNPPISIKPTDSKKEMTRIDLSQAKPPPAKASMSDTQLVHAEGAHASPLDLQKHGAIRVEPSQASKSETHKIAPRPMSETMHVEIAEPRKTETTRINIPPEAFEIKPGATPSSKLPEGAEDIFKRSTIPVGIPTPPPAPAARPKTISVKRAISTPVESAAVVPPDQRAVAEAKKSETARIDLPADTGERPATRPKTIRIKRPDGTTARKALTIARPDDESVVAGRAPIRSEESVGAAFSVLSLVAVLVSCILIYVLAAQTFAPELPFPGRL